MYGFSKKMFIELLSFSESSASIVNVSDYTKSIFLHNQIYMTR